MPGVAQTPKLAPLSRSPGMPINRLSTRNLAAISPQKRELTLTSASAAQGKSACSLRQTGLFDARRLISHLTYHFTVCIAGLPKGASFSCCIAKDRRYIGDDKASIALGKQRLC